MSDFFGEYAAPGILLAGVGTTAYRTIRDVRGRGIVSNRWSAMTDQRTFLSSFKAAQADRYSIANNVSELSGLFYPNSSRYKNLTELQTPEAVDAFRKIRRMSVSNLVTSFDLGITMRRMGVGDLGDITQAQLQQVMGISPQHAQHMDRIASSFSLSKLVNLGSADDATNARLGASGRSALKDILEIGNQFSGTQTLGQLMTASGAGNEFALGRHSRFVDIRTEKQLVEALEGAGRSKDLVTESLALFQRTRATKDLSMQLKILDEGSGDILAGLRIQGNKAFGSLDIPHVLNDGSVRIGHYGTQKMIARNVLSPNLQDFLDTGRGQMHEKLDTALTRHLTRQFDTFTGVGPKKWNKFLTNLMPSHREDVGKLLLPATMNPALNAKLATQIATRNVAIGPQVNDDILAAADRVVADKGLDAWAGISPNQRAAGVRSIPTGNRPYGVGALGTATGDDKTLAQMLRPKIITGKARSRHGRRIISGVMQRKAGDVQAMLRTYSMPQVALESMLMKSGRMDLGLHEDIALLLDKRISYGDFDTLRLGGHGQLSEFTNNMMTSEAFADFRAAAQSKIGVSGTLRNLREQMRTASKEDRKLLGARISTIKEQRTLTSNHILGERAGGGVVRGADGGHFLVDKLHWSNEARGINRSGKQELIMEGVREKYLRMGDKIFGMKRTLQEMDSLEGRFFATLYQATKGEDAVRAAVASGDRAALDAYYHPMISQFQEAVTASGGDLSLGDLRLSGVNADTWSSSLALTRNTQLLDVQGFKRIGERTKAQLTEGLMGELAAEYDTTTRRIGSLMGLNPNPEIFDRVLAANPELGEKWYSLSGSMERLGITRLAEGNNPFRLGFSIDDALEGAGPEDPRNLANRFDQTLLESMEEGNPYGIKRWSGRQALSDLASWSAEKYEENLGIAKDLVDEHRTRYAALASQSSDEVRATISSMLKDTSGRQALIYGVQPQLQFGAYNRVAAIGGDSAKVLGMGGKGSFSIGMYKHMKEQGGVMAELGMSFAGRLTGEKTAEAEEIYKRVLSLEHGVGSNMKTVSMLDFAESKFSADGYIEQMFGRNQESRSQVFSEIRAHYGLEKSDNLIFNLGENRFLYHGENVSKLSAPFSLPDGTLTPSGLDTSAQDIIEGFKVKDQGQIDEAISGYRSALEDVAFGKDKSPTRFLSGETLGSRRLQTVPNFNEDFLKFIDSNYKNKVGITETNFSTMLAEMGDVGNYDERLGLLRQGLEGGVIARNPATELHRITSANFFSLDEAYRSYEKKLVGQGSIGELSAALLQLNREKFVKTQARLQNDLVVHEEIKARVDARKTRLLAERQADLDIIENSHPGKSAEAEKTRAQLRAEHKKKFAGNLGSDDWTRNQIEIETQNHERNTYLAKIREEMMGRVDNKSVFIPKSFESLLGADFDADAIDTFLAKGGTLPERLRERASYKTSLLDQFDIGKMGSADEMDRAIQSAISGASGGEQMKAAEDFAYTVRQKQLFGSLKDKPGGVIAAQDLVAGTPQWKVRQAGSAMMAELEKGSIGPMTNATDFVRDVLRAQSGRESVDARIFSELLLGIMPETALKARQAGALNLQKTINDLGDSVGSSIKTLQSILSGDEVGKGREHMIREFNQAFKNVHDPMGRSNVVPDLLKFTDRVIDAVGAGKRPENLYAKFLKRTDDSVSLRQLAKNLLDPTAPWVQGEMGKEAARSLGIELDGPVKTNLRMASNTFSDVVQVMKSHRRPALIGAGLAIGAALVLGNPGSISAEEADGAGARRDLSAPTPEPPGFSSAPVSTNGGRSIRVRARSSGEVDTSRISAMMESRFGGADVSYTMNDLRTKINQEFVRKQLERT